MPLHFRDIVEGRRSFFRPDFLDRGREAGPFLSVPEEESRRTGREFLERAQESVRSARDLLSPEIQGATERLAAATRQLRESEAMAAKEQSAFLRNQILGNLLGPGLFGAITGAPLDNSRTERLLDAAGEAQLREIQARRLTEGSAALDFEQARQQAIEQQASIDQLAAARAGAGVDLAAAVQGVEAGAQDLDKGDLELDAAKIALDENIRKIARFGARVPEELARIYDQAIPGRDKSKELTFETFLENKDLILEKGKLDRAQIMAVQKAVKTQAESLQELSWLVDLRNKAREQDQKLAAQIDAIVKDTNIGTRLAREDELNALTRQRAAVQREIAGYEARMPKVAGEAGVAAPLANVSFSPGESEDAMVQMRKSILKDAQALGRRMREEGFSGDINEALLEIDNGLYDNSVPPALRQRFESAGISPADRVNLTRTLWRQAITEAAKSGAK